MKMPQQAQPSFAPPPVQQPQPTFAPPPVQQSQPPQMNFGMPAQGGQPSQADMMAMLQNNPQMMMQMMQMMQAMNMGQQQPSAPAPGQQQPPPANASKDPLASLF